MESITDPAVSSSLHRLRPTSSAHSRALTVNLMELLDWRENDNKDLEMAMRKCTAAYTEFDPERLWQTADDFPNEGTNNSEMFQSVIVVFGDGPVEASAGFSEAGENGIVNGSVLQFLVSRTNFLQHIETYPALLGTSAPSCEKDVERVERDGVRAVLLFTDVRMKGLEDDGRALSVVYVQLAKNGPRFVDRAAVQRRATQVINATHALFPEASRVTFWVDFTGILDFSGSLLLHEVREVWWSLAFASASASTGRIPKVTVFIDHTAIPTLQGDSAVVKKVKREEEEEEEKNGVEGASLLDAGNNISGVDGSACMLCTEHSPMRYEEISLSRNNPVTSAAPPAPASAPENDDSDGGNDLIWKKCSHQVAQHSQSSPQEAPQGLSCLFLECLSDSSLDSIGWDASMRKLLVLWSSLGDNHPPRIVVMITNDGNYLENALLSWVQVPWTENALILPLFGVSEVDTRQEFCSDMEPLSSLLSSSSSSSSTALMPLAMDDASTCGRFFRILTFAVQYFGIDVYHSACLALTAPFQEAANSLKCRIVGDYAHVFSWVMQSHVGNAAARGLLDVEEERERIFVELCATNALARKLRDRPRRPEVLLRLVGCMRLGIVRPVVRDAVALAPMSPIAARMRRSFDAVLSLSSEERTRVYRFLSSFFTKDVFSVSVDIVRSCGRDYFSGCRFLVVGYLRYELSSWVRRHVLVDINIDFQPLLKECCMDSEEGTEPHWSRVFRRFSCTCTPRRHERLLQTETGEKKCRHMVQLLYWFMQPRLACSTPFSTNILPSDTELQKRYSHDDMPIPPTNVLGPNTVKRGANACIDPTGVGVTKGGKSVLQRGEFKTEVPFLDDDVSILEFAHRLGMTGKS